MGLHSHLPNKLLHGKPCGCRTSRQSAQSTTNQKSCPRSRNSLGAWCHANFDLCACSSCSHAVLVTRRTRSLSCLSTVLCRQSCPFLCLALKPSAHYYSRRIATYLLESFVLAASPLCSRPSASRLAQASFSPRLARPFSSPALPLRGSIASEAHFCLA